jgi:hypothetical protein
LFEERGTVGVEVAGAGFLERGDGGIGDLGFDAAVVADVGRGVAVVFASDDAGGEGGEVAGSGAREIEEFARSEAAVEGFAAGGGEWVVIEQTEGKGERGGIEFAAVGEDVGLEADDEDVTGAGAFEGLVEEVGTACCGG